MESNVNSNRMFDEFFIVDYSMLDIFIVYVDLNEESKKKKTNREN